jgi:hypothetical protein
MRTKLAVLAFVLVVAAAPLLAGGVVEIETAAPVTTISRDELEELPVRRDLAEIAKLVPNAVGVVRFGAEPGSYSLTLRGAGQGEAPGGLEAIREAPFVVGADEVRSLRLGADGRLVDNPDPFRTSVRPPDAQVARGCDIAYRAENQLVTVELTTPHGTIYVSAPELAPAGATTAWTSTVVPSGASERERARNLATLEAYRLWVGNPAVLLPPGGGARVPSNGAAQIALRDGDRTLAVGTVVLLRSPEWQGGTGGVAQPRSAPLPPVFAGGALTVPGSFDGDLSNTRVTVDGRPVRVVAESPYGVSIYTPGDRIGRLEIVVEEGLQRGSGAFYNLGLEIAADKTDLRRGETTTCRIAVHGLAGLGQTVDLVLINRTPGVVAMAPSDRQLLRIVPGSHDAAGTLRIERRFTGIVRGQFHLQAVLLPPGARLPGAPR